MKKINSLNSIFYMFVIAIVDVFILHLTLWFAYDNESVLSFSNAIYFFLKPEHNVPIWLLNVFFLMSFQFLLIILTNRFIVSHIISNIVIFIICVGEYLKIDNRSEPIIPADMYDIEAIFESIKFIDKNALIIPIIIIVLAIGLIIFVYKRDYKVFSNTKIRLSSILVPLFMGTLYFNRPAFNDVFLDMGDNQTFKFDATIDASTNGFVVGFANNIIGQPYGDMPILKKYNEQTIKNIVKKYNDKAKIINKTRANKNFDGQTVIYVLSESFSDPMKIPNIQYNFDSIPRIRKIQSETTSGQMIANGIGGGTANTEYSVISGMSMANFNTQVTPFLQIVPKQKVFPSVADLFDTKIAIHPFLPNYYNRPGVYKKMGISYFYNTKSDKPLSNLNKIDNNKYYSDETSYQNALEKISADKKSQYIELVTMQNHMPYPKNEYLNNEFQIIFSKDFNPNEDVQRQYAKGLNYTDIATQNFLNSLDNMDRPVTVVFYGDHTSAAFAPIWKNVPGVTNNIKAHRTEYFIYQNKKAKEVNGTKNVSKQMISPIELTPLMLNQNNMKISGFYTMLTELNKQPAILNYLHNNKNLSFYKDENTIIKYNRIINKEHKQLIDDYQLIQYDLTNGKQYSVKYNMFDK